MKSGKSGALSSIKRISKKDHDLLKKLKRGHHRMGLVVTVLSLEMPQSMLAERMLPLSSTTSSMFKSRVRFTFQFTKDIWPSRRRLSRPAPTPRRLPVAHWGQRRYKTTYRFTWPRGGACGETTAALVGAGVNVNCRLKSGATSLDLSACCGRLGAVRILIRGKANPSLPVA